jgi:hypothetical protein
MINQLQNLWESYVNYSKFVETNDGNSFLAELRKQDLEKLEIIKTQIKELVKNNKQELEQISSDENLIPNFVEESLKKFYQPHYGLQSILEDYPDEEENNYEKYKELSRYWSCEKTFYHSLGIDSLKTIRFYLNLENIIKEFE